MPSEVEQILLPYHTDNDELLPVIDEMMREKKNIEEILKLTNRKFCGRSLDSATMKSKLLILFGKNLPCED